MLFRSGLHDFEKFEHDGGDAAEMAGARAAFEAVAEAVDIDVGAKAGRIDVGGLRREDGIDARGLEFLGVGIEGTRIFGEIFVGAELGGVEEYRRDDLRTFAAGTIDERHVAGVERAHCRHEADDFVFGAREVRGLFHPGDGADCFHVGEFTGNFVFDGNRTK